MKKILLLIIGCFLLTGCMSNTNFANIYVYTTIYPIEYVTDYLYSDFANVKSIYPNGINIKEYKLTKKQKNTFSNGKTLVYDGLSDEVKIAVDLLNKNSNLQIIDSMKGMNYTNDIAELWLDPSHYLMIARNIKAGLIEYEDNVYTKEKIEKKYEELKIGISELDVELTVIGKNAKYKTILVASPVLNYLEKYGINVIDISIDNTNIDKAYADARKLIDEEKVLYLYKTKNTILNEAITNYASINNLEVLSIDTLENLTDEQKTNNNNYVTIMNENIDLLRKELLK